MLAPLEPPLRVLRISSVFAPPDEVLRGRGARFDPLGGMQCHTGQLTRALASRGVRQTVLTTRPPGAPRRSLELGADVLRHGLPIRTARQLWATPAAVSALRLARDADLVHAHAGEDVAVLPLALAAARRAGVPLVVTLHTSVAHTFVAAGLRGHALRLLGGAAERAVVGRADAVIALTGRLASLLLDAGVAPDRVHVVPSGVTPADFTPAAADPFPALTGPRVAFVGRLHRQKGISTLIDAAALLRTPGARLVIVGDGPERAAAEAAVARRGLAARVHFAGFLPHREVPAVLRHADVLAMPSAYEELGTVLLEAMQAGVPIVASRTGGIPDAVGDTAELVAPGDAPALAAALDGLLADRDRAVELGARARERAGRYDWDRLAGEVLDAYARALGRPVAASVAAPRHRVAAPPAE